MRSNFVDKQAREAKIIDIAIPGDARVKDEELEKIEKYQLLLREEKGKMSRLKKVTVVPIVIGALGGVSDMFKKCMGKLDVTIRLEVIQKTTLLGTAGLLRRVLSFYFYFTDKVARVAIAKMLLAYNF